MKTIYGIGCAAVLACMVAFTSCGAPSTPDDSVGSVKGDTQTVVGINNIAPEEVMTILPQAQTQPTMVAFKTKYCHDCQEMAPHIAAIKEQHPGVSVISVDVQYDKETYGHIIEAFKPSTVPTVVYIQQGGMIHQTLLGRQERAQLQNGLEAILPAEAPVS